MVLDRLGSSLKETLAKITGATYIDEKLVNELVKDIQRALLQSDVNVKLVFDLTKRIKERAMKEKAPTGIAQKEHLVKIVYEELVSFLGEEEKKIDVNSKKPFNIMLVGLFGNGKTTTSGKLADYFKKRGMKVGMISLDVWRPAAFEQLRQLGKQLDVSVFGDPKEKSPDKIYNKFKKELSQFDVVIIDTAGRDALSDELIVELNLIHKTVAADEVLLVIGADVGQAAEKQAQTFHDVCGVNGVIITKLDGTAKGGGALSACAVTGAKVKFIGLGEKIDDFEVFDPEGFVGRLLGMGDLKALLEKAREAISEEDAEDLGKRLLKGEFNLIDLYEQMRAMKKMGSIKKLIELIPGLGSLKLPKEALDVQESRLKIWKHIMDSCTRKELEDPDMIDHQRIERISTGSGTNPKDVRELLKQYRMGKKMVKMMKGSSSPDMDKMMKKMGRMKGMKGMPFGKMPGLGNMGDMSKLMKKD